MKKRTVIEVCVAATLVVAGALYLESDPVPDDRTAVFAGDRAPAVFAGASVQSEFWSPSVPEIDGSQAWIRLYIASQRTGIGAKIESLFFTRWSLYVRQVVGVRIDGRRIILMRYLPAIDSQEVTEGKRKYCEERGIAFDPGWWKTTGEISSDGAHVDFWISYDVDARRFVSYATNG